MGLSKLCLFFAFFVLSLKAGTFSQKIPGGCKNNVCPTYDYSASSDWSRLCPDFAQCAGNQQSPVDITGVPKSGTPSPLSTLFAPTRVTLFNTGQQLLLPVPDYTGVLTLNNIVYSFSGAMFHTPSEHTVNGTRFDAEIQLLYNSVQGKQLAISLLFTRGITNPILDSFWSDLPTFTNCSCGNGRFEPWTGEACDDGPNNSDVMPNTCRVNCQWFWCGDGVIDASEDCDNGELNSNTIPNSCRVGCVLPRCGDGVADSNYGEECDDGNNFNGDGCTANCQKENYCGNGVLDFGEQCDNGLLNSDTVPDACRTNCTNAQCGDGVVDSGELCDPNVPYPSYSLRSTLCRSNCTFAYCGDGIVDDLLGEECDEISDRCDECHLLCGDGKIEGSEQCDDGFLNSNILPNRCRTNCTNPVCGDGVTDNGEQCDAGNLNGIPGGRCSTNCTILCGNGIIDFGEQCDNGTANSDTTPDACRTNCRFPACGDNVTDIKHGEQCDAGGPFEFCRPNCRLPLCGDGYVDTFYNEECDDGNLNSADGCSEFCLNECGNGVFDGTEQCDNGPLNSDTKPDACRTNCTKPFCGDGVIDSFEECDEGQLNSNAPNQCRPNCKVPYCGDGILDTASGESCDDGKQNSDTTVDGCSTTCVQNQCRQSVSNAYLDFGKLFPPQCESGYFTYTGSKTFPPCTEGVQWIVFEQIGHLSPDQLNRLQDVLGHNARPTQPLGKRMINYPTTNGQRCGNGIREGTEQCDDPKGNSDDQPNRCRKNCQLPSCGDGVVDCGEECDSGPVCTSECTIGTGSSANKTVVNMFFKDLIPYNYFCCNANAPQATTSPCPSCYKQ